MRIRADFTDFRREIRNIVGGIQAFEETLRRTGRGEIVVSKRRPIPGERRPPLHGKAIANILRSKGGDVFKIPTSDAQRLADELAEGSEDIFREAARSGRPQHAKLRKLLRRVTREYRDLIVRRIERGQTGRRKSPKTAERQEKLIERGAWWITRKYGIPPPWAIASGRFVEGIRARISRSRKAVRAILGEAA